MPEVIDPNTILRRLPYQGLVTFWRAPYVQDLEGVDVAVYGVPFDAGASNRPGARFGPRAGETSTTSPPIAAAVDSCSVGKVVGEAPRIPGLDGEVELTLERAAQLSDDLDGQVAPCF